MKQMTIRSFDPALEKGIVELSEQKGWPINRVALYLMRKGLGITEEVQPTLIGNQLSHFFGTWNEEEAKGFDHTIHEEFEKIDLENWK